MVRAHVVRANGFVFPGLLLLSLASFTPSAAAQVCFELQPATNAGPYPLAVGSADFDGDGDVDLAVADANVAAVAVFLNQGDGTFAPFVQYGTGTVPCSVTCADFDADGDFDLALTNQASDNLSVLLNNGDGTFAAQQPYLTNYQPSGIASGDIDGDGDIDLVAANTNSQSNNLSVRYNQGNGVFFGGPSIPVGLQPVSAAIADLDGDGDGDLVAANRTTSNVSVALNLGGSFATHVTYPVGGAPQCVVSGDLDGDGDADLVTANAAGSVSVLLNNGNGTFAAQVPYAVGAQTRTVSLGDIDADGDLDLATSNMTPDTASVLLNQGNGTFAAQVSFGVDTDPVATTLADFDGDGDLDLAVTCVGTNKLSLLRSCRLTGIAFCFGDGLDPNVTTPCPCANFGAPGHGCGNSASTGGALLSASGTNAPDAIDLSVADVPPGVSTIYLQGDANASAGIVFGDGIRCSAGQLVRLGLKHDTDLDGSTTLGPGVGDAQVSVTGAITPGSTYYYQTYYRNPNATWCPPQTFNVSNGLAIEWQ